MIWYFRNKTTLAWFVIGMICVAIPVGYVLELKGIKLDIYSTFLIAACGAALGAWLTYLIQRLLAKRKFMKLSKYWKEKSAQDLAEASKKYPIKNLEKGTEEFKEQFAKNIDYFEELNNASKKEFIKEFKLSNADWAQFTAQSMMGFDRHRNMTGGKKL